MPLAPMLCLLLGLLLGLNLTGCQAPSSPAATPSGPAAQATIRLGGAPHDLASAAGFVYGAGESTISVIDARTDAVVTTLSLPAGKPGRLEAGPDGKLLFVLSPDADSIYVYDPARNHALLQTIEAGSGPDTLRFSADGRKAWVSLRGEAAVTELDFSAGFTAAPAIRKLAAGKAGDGRRALASGLRWLATPNPGDKDISLIDRLEGGQSRVLAGDEPAAVAIGGWDAQDQVLLVANAAADTVTLYHLGSKLPITLREVGQSPTGIALVPDQPRAFVSMAGSGELTAIDYRQQKVLARIAVGQRPADVRAVSSRLQIQHGSHDHSEIWVSNGGDGTLSVVDADSLKLKATVTVGKGPHELAFWSHKVFVANAGDGTVSVLDRSRLVKP